MQKRQAAGSGKTLELLMRTVKNRLSDRRKRKLRGTLFVFFCVMTIFLALLLRVRISDRAVELAYEIGQLAAEKSSLEEENRKLELEIARLKTPERISKIAVSDLKMVRASEDTEVIVLER